MTKSSKGRQSVGEKYFQGYKVNCEKYFGIKGLPWALGFICHWIFSYFYIDIISFVNMGPSMVKWIKKYICPNPNFKYGNF
jgi:hypothetical protein